MNMDQENKQEELKNRAQQVHTGSGVYRMMGKGDEIIYIGKAKNLRSRVSSYFQKLSDPKTKVLVSRIEDFDVILTDSEAEALILECILIKKYSPRYNVMLKDDKSYPYLVVDFHHSFPKLTYTRRFKQTKDMMVFGPYVSSGSLRQTIELLSHSFQLRECTDTEFANRSRPCISHQMGFCSAPCTNLITAENYKKDLEMALEILKGRSKETVEELRKKMNSLSKKMEYELAAKVRDQIQGLETLLFKEEQKVTKNTNNKLGQVDMDVIGFCRKENTACLSIIFLRGGSIVDSSNFISHYLDDMSAEEILVNFLGQLYLTDNRFPQEILSSNKKKHPLGMIPKAPPSEILLPTNLEEFVESKKSLSTSKNIQLLKESLSQLGFSSKITESKRGVKYKLAKMAEKNASNALTARKEEDHNIYKTLTDIKVKLKLQNYPRRIECFDISNLGDKGIVGSCVTFIEGKPDKKLYRHYKIKSVHTQNDFASMEEILTRRLKKSSKYGSMEQEAPDLVIVDGGKSQLAMAVEVMKELDITGIDLAALAKSKVVSDFKSKKIEKSMERVFKPGRKNPIPLTPGSKMCLLLERIRNEAHRFAITLQRKQRTLPKK